MNELERKRSDGSGRQNECEVGINGSKNGKRSKGMHS